MSADENVKCFVSPFPGLPRTGSDSQETARSPETSKTVVQQIAALRKSLEDKSPQEIKDSPSNEGEYILVAPIRGIDEDGRLILGDRRILSASALKI